MTAALRIVRAGPACTLQDQGRRGFLRFGVTTAGPMDWIAHAEARLLAGNGASGPAIEIGPGGLDVVVEGGPIRLGLSVEGFKAAVAGRSLAPSCAITLQPGEQISISPGPSHLWAYLAWAGDTSLRPVMGSFSTHVRSGLGPFDGKPMAAGMTIPIVHDGRLTDQSAVELPNMARPVGGTVRFIVGPQASHFTPESVDTFSTSEYRVTGRSDRMGYRLDGRQLQHTHGHDIVSDGIAMGAIQIPGDGLPIVLMADRGSTGGYPKIGTVIRADLPALAQARPGTAIRFQRVSIEDAVVALKAAVPDRSSIAKGAIVRRELNLELLSSGDYAGGVVSALSHPPGNTDDRDVGQCGGRTIGDAR